MYTFLTSQGVQRSSVNTDVSMSTSRWEQGFFHLLQSQLQASMMLGVLWRAERLPASFCLDVGGKPHAKQKPNNVLHSIAINAFSRCDGSALSMIHCSDVGLVFFSLCWSSSSSPGLAVGCHAANLSAILGKILSPKCCCKL